MKHWLIYQNENGLREAVKNGFSWPAFFFAGIWALCKRLYWAGAIGLAIILALNKYSPAGDVVVVPLSLAVMFVFGYMGNGWVCSRLERQGFTRVGEVVAASMQGALQQFSADGNAPKPAIRRSDTGLASEASTEKVLDRLPDSGRAPNGLSGSAPVHAATSGWRFPLLAILVVGLVVAAAAFQLGPTTSVTTNAWRPSAEWSARVDSLRQKLSAREISELPSTITRIAPNGSRSFPNSAAQTLEASQTWWKAGDTVYIHVDNRTTYTLGGLGIEFSERRCEANEPTSSWSVSSIKKLNAGQQAIFSFRSKEITSGCLVIVSAWN